MTQKEKESICMYEEWTRCQLGKKCRRDLQFCLPRPHGAAGHKECKDCFDEWKKEGNKKK